MVTKIAKRYNQKSEILTVRIIIFHIHMLIHIPFIFVLSYINIAALQVVKKKSFHIFTIPLSGNARPT